ncbi:MULTISPECIES: hypothetical protein [Glutamicibacter]|uniref:helix-turn-helix transcriptional regulator n=1 Tax=Glutamicibacter TaxID=1742989 RepID=UPI003079591F
MSEDKSDWLTTEEVKELLGISDSGIRQRRLMSKRSEQSDSSVKAPFPEPLHSKITVFSRSEIEGYMATVQKLYEKGEWFGRPPKFVTKDSSSEQDS